MAQFNITISEELLHELFLSKGKDKAFSKLLEEIFNQVLLAQSSEQIGASLMRKPKKELPIVMGIATDNDYQGWHTYTAGSQTSQWSVQYRAVCPISTQ